MTTDLLLQKQASDDPAAQAFERVREELALLHQAVKGMAADRHELVIPDYSATLEKMAGQLEAKNKALEEIAEKPALRLTPEALGAQIKKAADVASQTQRDELQSARNSLVNATNAIVARVNSARDGDEQKLWNWGFGAGGIVIGILIAASWPQIADRIAPASWHWREHRAASALGMSMTDAGMHLISVEDPDKARNSTAAAHILEDNAPAIDGCAKAAAEAKKPKRCFISVKPGEGEPPKWRK